MEASGEILLVSRALGNTATIKAYQLPTTSPAVVIVAVLNLSQQVISKNTSETWCNLFHTMKSK